MPRIITLSIEVEDGEIANLLEYFNQTTSDRLVTLDAGNGPVTPNLTITPIATPEAGDATVDKNGHVWNESVHSSTKGFNADGTWRKRKGVSKETIAAYDASMAGTGAGVVIPETAAPIPTLPVLPVSMPPIPAPVIDVPVTYAEVVLKFNELNTAGKLPSDVVTAVYAAAGVTDVTTLQTDETQRRAIMAELNKL